MNVDRILGVFNSLHVDYILIGGMNFLFTHEPVLTYDIDLWMEDSEANRTRCEKALIELQCSWGETDDTWQLLADRKPGWLGTQAVYCLSGPHGSIDIFLQVAGLPDWKAAKTRSRRLQTATNVPFQSLSDYDMLQSQLALPEGERKPERIRVLREAVEASHGT